MNTNIFISSLGTQCEYLKEIIKPLKEALHQENALALFIPSQKEIYEGAAEWEILFIDALKNHGIHFKEAFALFDVDDAQYWQASIQKASLIYLHGGNPLVQQAFYEEKGIYEMLRNYEGVMLGASAGAMNMSQSIMLTPTNEEYNEMVIQPALNRSGVNIFPHLNFDGHIQRYVMTGDGLVDLEDLKTLSKEADITLLEDGQFVIDHNDIQIVTGDIHYQLKDGQLFANQQKVEDGFENVSFDERQLTKRRYRKVHYYNTMEEAVNYGLIGSLFNVMIDESRHYQRDVKLIGMKQPCHVTLQLRLRDHLIFNIQHPQLLRGGVVYKINKWGQVEEIMTYQSIFTRKIEEIVLSKCFE